MMRSINNLHKRQIFTYLQSIIKEKGNSNSNHSHFKLPLQKFIIPFNKFNRTSKKQNFTIHSINIQPNTIYPCLMEIDLDKEQFKRQALEFILSIYLQRQNDEDVKFIQDNVKSTAEFAKNISSSLKYGLSESTVEKNRRMYGRNSKRTVRTFSLRDIITRVIKLHNILIFSICIIQVIFGTVLKNREIYMDAVYTLVLLACVSLIRIVTIFLNEKKKSQQSYEKNKNEKYRVFRDGNFIELQQTRIVVGDIIELDYKEKVPASGILISNQQIAMNEEIYGKKTQRKMCLEKSISYINKLSVLELKIDAEKQTLPSPIILRGTEQVYGSTYRILVIAVDEQNLLEKHKVPDDSTFASEIIKDWFQKLQFKVGRIMLVISVIYLTLFMSVFSLKQYLERKHLSVQMFFTDLFSVLLMSILSFSVFDTNCLRLFVQTQVISYTENLNNPKQVDKYLTVEQLYITEDNIVKYDEIIVCQVGIPDKENVVKYGDLSVLSQNVRQKVEQVLQGVGLRQKSSSRKQLGVLNMKEEPLQSDHDNRFNQIVHLNTVDQKIFTSLINPGYQQIKKQGEQLKLKTKQLSNSNGFNAQNQQENASSLSLNRVTPYDDQILNEFKRTKFRKKDLTNSDKKDVHNQENLKGYLSEFCKFKTQNIVQGIVQLAKQQSKTYYYQKYSISRLKKIPYVYQNGCEHQMNKQRIEKTKRLARNVRVVQGLTPFLIGYSEGAYSNSSMNVLVAVVGVKINYENEIIRRLKELGTLGIKSTILIHKRQQEEKDSLLTKDNFLMTSKITTDFHEEQDYAKSVCAEYVSRGWISQQAQEMIDFPTLKQSGGAIRCQSCFLSRCDCKDRIQQLCNIQNFISQSQNTKIIHSIDTQLDINYLKVGSEQIRNSVLLINKYKSQTVKILQGIKRGYYLSNILQKGQNVWYGFMFVSAVCFYPLSLVSFGGVFCSGDISLWILFIQFLAVIGNMDISIEAKENTESESRRKKVLYSKKSTMQVFLLCMISTIVATVFYIEPTLFIKQSFTEVAAHLQHTKGIVFDRDCHYKFSIFLSEDFNNLQCVAPTSDLEHSHQSHSQLLQYVYSQNVNFIYSYLCLNMLIFLMINFRNFTRPKVLLVYACLFGVYFYVIYVLPDIIHGRYDGLTPGQLAIVFGMSILTNLVIQCVAYWSGYSCAVCDTEEFQSILAFEDDVENHYSAKLKKYSAFQTQIYTLN